MKKSYSDSKFGPWTTISTVAIIIYIINEALTKSQSLKPAY